MRAPVQSSASCLTWSKSRIASRLWISPPTSPPAFTPEIGDGSSPAKPCYGGAVVETAWAVTGAAAPAIIGVSGTVVYTCRRPTNQTCGPRARVSSRISLISSHQRGERYRIWSPGKGGDLNNAHSAARDGTNLATRLVIVDGSVDEPHRHRSILRGRVKQVVDLHRNVVFSYWMSGAARPITAPSPSSWCASSAYSSAKVRVTIGWICPRRTSSSESTISRRVT